MAVSGVRGLLLSGLGLNTVAALFWTAAFYRFLAPPLVVVLLLVADNKSVIGERGTRGR